MIPDCVDPLTNSTVQDCLRRRDEAIEILIDEVKETDRLKEHYKQKLEEKEIELNHKRIKWWRWWLFCGLSMAVILYFTYKHYQRWLSI